MKIAHTTLVSGKMIAGPLPADGCQNRRNSELGEGRVRVY